MVIREGDVGIGKGTSEFDLIKKANEIITNYNKNHSPTKALIREF